jgi:phosphatidylglycerophosphate synthase
MRWMACWRGVLKQRTDLGEYLDPVADKLLLSTLFSCSPIWGSFRPG